MRRADISSIGNVRSLRSFFPTWPATTIDFLSQCLRMDPDTRPTCAMLLDHPLFTQDSFSQRFLTELKDMMMDAPLTQQRLGSRRLTALPPERPARICHSSTGRHDRDLNNYVSLFLDRLTSFCSYILFESRWQMTLIRGGGTCNAMCQPEIEQARESVASIERQPLLAINRAREPCYFGPVSVVPNTTYIRRLEHRGVQLVPGTKGCSLPALASRESSHAKENTKRKRVDLPHVDR